MAGRAYLRRLAWFAAILVALTAPAEARRFRIPIFGFGHHGSSAGTGPRERIDFVRDLPDGPPFRKDGYDLDVGFKYTQHLTDGAVDREERANGQFVLYHGITYMALDAEGRSLLTRILGEDPTAGYDRYGPRRERLAKSRAAGLSTAERIRLAREDAAQAMPRADPVEPGERKRSSAAFGLGMAVFVSVLVVYWLRRARRQVASAVGAFTRPMPEAQPEPIATGSFDARVKARLAELQSGGTAGPTLPPQTPAVRTFGRRAA